MTFTSLSYSLKIWLTSIFLSPFICLIIGCILNPGSSLMPLEIYPVIIIVEFIFSLLTWLAFLAAIALVMRFIENDVHRKLVLLLAGVIFTIVTYLVCFFDEIALRTDGFIYEMMLSNCLCIAAGAVSFKLANNTSEKYS